MKRTVKHSSRGSRQAYVNTRKYDPNRYKKENEQLPEDVLQQKTCLCCRRCCEVIQWKVDYGHYTVLERARRCNICGEKTVTLAYHHICQGCARERRVCAKCQRPPVQNGLAYVCEAVCAAGAPPADCEDNSQNTSLSTNESADEPRIALCQSSYAFVDRVADSVTEPELRALVGLDTRVLAQQMKAEKTLQRRAEVNRMRERERRTALRTQPRKSSVGGESDLELDSDSDM